MDLKKLKPVTRTIDGHVVEVTPLPARLAINYKFSFLNVFGKPLMSLIKGPIAALLPKYNELKSRSKDGGALMALLATELDMDSIPDALFSDVDPDKATGLVMTFCATARVDNDELTESTINVKFVGNLLLLYKVFFFVLEVNYKNFLSVEATTDK
jgi:hypothetical protein